MATFCAYVLVVPLAPLILLAAPWFAGAPIILCLSLAPLTPRVKAGVIGAGIAGVAAAVAFAYGVFHLLVGPGSFSIGPFLAATLPLLIPTWKDYREFGIINQSRKRGLEYGYVDAWSEADWALAGWKAGGKVIGLIIVTVWFFCR